MLSDRWGSLLLKIIIPVQYVECCKREVFRCLGAERVAGQGVATASQEGGRLQGGIGM